MSAREEFENSFSNLDYELEPKREDCDRVYTWDNTEQTWRGFKVGLEVAAKVCDENHEHYIHKPTAKACAEEIRKLKDGEQCQNTTHK